MITKRVLPLVLIVMLTAGCTQIDCPLNNAVYTNYRFMNSVGDSVVITDTITITTRPVNKEDSVLINQLTGKCDFSLPISYQSPQDVFFFEIKGKGYSYRDTVRVMKQDRPHFESVDCNPSFFHTLTGVETTHHAIDSITIRHNNVDYDTTKKHLHIHLRSSN